MGKLLHATTVAFFFWIALSSSADADNLSRSGTWHVVEARTWWSDRPTPKGFSLELILSFSGKNFSYRSINDTDKAQAPQVFQFAATLDGAKQAVPDRKAGEFDQISFQETGPGLYRMLRWLKGELVAVQYWTFMPGDTEMVRRGATKTSAGPWHAYEEWFVRK